jgi:hypothetical protein
VGAVVVKNNLGDVEVAAVRGSASVENAHAAILLRDVSRAAVVRGSHGRIEARHVGQGVQVFGENGDVSITDAGGSVFIKTSHGLVQAARVGALTVDSEDSAIRAASIRGPAVIRTTAASVVLSDVDGSVDVKNEGGPVEVSGFSPKGPQGCHRVSLATSFAPIKLTLPEGVGFNIAAKASLGKIRSQPPLTTATAAESFVGPVGGGGCEVTLANTIGDITLVPGGFTARR